MADDSNAPDDDDDIDDDVDFIRVIFSETEGFCLLVDARDLLSRTPPDIAGARRLIATALDDEEFYFQYEIDDGDGWARGGIEGTHGTEIAYARAALVELDHASPRPLYALAMLERCLHPAADAKEPRKNPLMILPPQVGAP